jgi:hypothetical protein
VLADAEPGVQVAGEGERGVAVGADGGVDGEGVEGVHGGVVDGADDPRRADDIPGCTGVGLAVVEQKVFLGVVEVGFEGDAGIGFEEGGAGAAEVDAVVLGAGLEEDAGRGEGGEREGGEEIAEECRWGGGVS